MNHLMFFKDFIYLFLVRGGGREKERKRNIDVQEKNIDQLPLVHAATGDRTHDPGMCLTSHPLFFHTAPNPLSHPDPG